jgi:S-adenosylmethionine:tRNA ribosyltransferase-isomerase
LTSEGLHTSDFDYHLPPELIAQEPLPERAGSRLLSVFRTMPEKQLPGNRRTLGDAELVDANFSDLPALIPPGDLLVLNTTRVRHARLLGTRPSGAPAEILLIHPGANETWVALGKPGSALRPGKQIRLGAGSLVETVDVLPDGNRLVRFIGLSADAAIRQYGRLPLPPYIDRPPTELDESRYQTVYARQEGSVAAPTAGLHFTPELLDALTSEGVLVEGLDLQVGPGTFKPVEVEDLAGHEMHPERFEIPTALASKVAAVHAAGGSIWAVGTTVVRALESAARDDGSLQAGVGETRLMISPGYTFRVVDHMVTNFHLPRSTLLMLVSAFAGHDLTMAAYRHAIEQRYRFYSYGDAMAII